LGRHYPSSDPRYKDISSLRLLEDVLEMLTKKGFRLVNLDTVIVAQAPRLGPHLDAMRARIAEVLKIEGTQVNVKVKSGEGLDAVGREEAIAAQAMCLIEPV
jgi:2-C-methyl-D-erythritol 2,4-cyclodiphosphate synthase